MKKIIILHITALAALSILFPAPASCVGNAQRYKMTVQQIQLRRTDGTWVTLSEPNQEIDIASVNAGAVAGSLVSQNPIPAGQYDNFKLIISETMKFSGQDGAHYTVNGGDVTVTGADANAASTATWGGATPNATLTETTESHTAVAPANVASEEITARLDLDAGDADTFIEVYARNNLNTPITVTSDSVVTMSFDFDTQDTVTYINYQNANDIMFFYPPQEGTRFDITADGTTTTLTENQMRIDF